MAGFRSRFSGSLATASNSQAFHRPCFAPSGLPVTWFFILHLQFYTFLLCFTPNLQVLYKLSCWKEHGEIPFNFPLVSPRPLRKSWIVWPTSSLMPREGEPAYLSGFDRENDEMDPQRHTFWDVWRLKPCCARLLCLTGAGFSTESGIPDYRSPEGSYSKGHKPMTHQEFISSAVNRKRYWARSLRGWRFFDGASPNMAHRALGSLEATGYVRGVITQNVDGLHQKGGSRNVIELHGRNDEVSCLSCSRSRSRSNYQEELELVNSEWISEFLPPQAVVDLRADGDAQLHVRNFDGFQVPSCSCGGVWKPRVVFFGGALETSIKERAQTAQYDAEALLVMGSSVQVFSAFSLVKAAVKAQKPVAILNIGETRADPLIPKEFLMPYRCGEALEEICHRLEIPIAERTQRKKWFTEFLTAQSLPCFRKELVQENIRKTATSHVPA